MAPERLWQLWGDPRQLERWWGPPTYPATFVEHDLRPSGHVSYYMTGPDGDRPHGWWRVGAVDAPNRLEFEDGFADESGRPNLDLPTMAIAVALTALPAGGTRMVVRTSFRSAKAMDQVLSMGMEEGMSSALSQIDGLLELT